jgi:hypothetical protein
MEEEREEEMRESGRVGNLREILSIWEREGERERERGRKGGESRKRYRERFRKKSGRRKKEEGLGFRVRVRVISEDDEKT